ncbi:NifU domain-containing protein [Pycnococcus provasolii]
MPSLTPSLSLLVRCSPINRRFGGSVSGTCAPFPTRRTRRSLARSSSTTSSLTSTSTSAPSISASAISLAPSEQQQQQQQPLVISPFTSGGVQQSLDDEAAETDTSKPLTAESANEALDTVRPYLQADGGDVNVVSVQSGVVLVELVGACGTCTQSAATLQLGVEGALKRAFGKQIVKVLQVAKRDSAAAAAATINDPTARADPERLANAESALAKRVDEHLDKVRGPLEKLGGSVTVSRFSLSETKLGEGGIVELSFQGPSALGMGIQQAVKEQFVREVKEVKLIQVR